MSKVIDSEGDSRATETENFLFNAENAKDCPTTPVLRGKSAELASIDHKPRWGNIWIFLIVTTMFSLESNYVLGYLNQMKELLQIKLGWVKDSQQEIWLYQTLNGVYNIGACIGALSAGYLLNIGRRKALLLTGCVFIIGAVLTQFMNFAMLCISRIIAGLGCGVSLVATSRIIEEYVPLAVYATASPFNIFMGQFGSFLALISAVVLPGEKAEEQEYLDNTSWRWIFGMSFVWIAIGMLGFIFLVRTDTPKFYISKKDDENAIAAIKTIYQTNGSTIQANRIKRFIEKSCNQQSTKISLLDSMWRDERYARASQVNVTIMSFHVLTGYAAVMAFSNTIFLNAQSASGGGLTPRQGTYMVGVCNLIAAMCGIYTVRTFGRRTVLLVGHSTIAVLHFMIATATILEWSSIQIGLTCIFIFVYMTTSGPCAWAYAAETCTDAALSMCVFTLYFWQTVESFTTETLMAWSPQGTFFIFGGITAVSVIFLYFFVGETKGLSEREKKEIFMPGASWGRELREGEQPFAELGQEHKSRRTLRSEMLSQGIIDDAAMAHTSLNLEDSVEKA